MPLEVGQIVYVTNPGASLISTAFINAVDDTAITLLFYTGAYALVEKQYVGVWPLQSLTSDQVDKSVSACPAEFFVDDPELEKESSSSTVFDDDIDGIVLLVKQNHLQSDLGQSESQPSIADREIPTKLELSTSLIEGTMQRKPSKRKRLKQKVQQRLPTKKIPLGQPVKPTPKQNCCSVQ